MDISPDALTVALIEIPKLKSASDPIDFTKRVSPQKTRDLWHSLRRLGWESPTNQEDAFFDNLHWWLTSENVRYGAKADNCEATLDQRLDDLLSRLQVLEQSLSFSPESRCEGFSHLRSWSVGQSFNSAPLGYPRGKIWHDSGRDPWDGAESREYFQLRFDDYAISESVNHAAERFEDAEQLKSAPTIDHCMSGQKGYPIWMVNEAKKLLERSLASTQDAWHKAIKESGEVLPSWKIFEHTDIQPVRDPSELRDWLNQILEEVVKCIVETEGGLTDTISEDISQKLLTNQLGEILSQPGPVGRVWGVANRFFKKQNGLFRGFTLQRASNELRNARKAFRVWGIDLPSQFDDEPSRLIEAEKQLERLIDSVGVNSTTRPFTTPVVGDPNTEQSGPLPDEVSPFTPVAAISYRAQQGQSFNGEFTLQPTAGGCSKPSRTTPALVASAASDWLRSPMSLVRELQAFRGCLSNHVAIHGIGSPGQTVRIFPRQNSTVGDGMERLELIQWSVQFNKITRGMRFKVPTIPDVSSFDVPSEWATLLCNPPENPSEKTIRLFNDAAPARLEAESILEWAHVRAEQLGETVEKTAASTEGKKATTVATCSQKTSTIVHSKTQAKKKTGNKPRPWNDRGTTVSSAYVDACAEAGDELDLKPWIEKYLRRKAVDWSAETEYRRMLDYREEWYAVLQQALNPPR